MKVKAERITIADAPQEVNQALFCLGHWLARNGNPDLKTNFTVIEGDEGVRYELEMKEVSRYPHTIEGEAK